VIETAALICLRSSASRRRKASTLKPPSRVSVIVASYNEEKNVDSKLANLFKQNYPKELMEVICVDSSTDKTPYLIKAWQQRYPSIRLILEDRRRGLAHALNIGYSAANGDIVVKSDCDILHDPDSIGNLLTNFSDERVGAVSGRQVLLGKNEVESGYRTLLDKKRELESRFGSAYIFETFSGFRRTLLEHIDEHSVADEPELALKIRKKGFYTILDENAIFYEQSPTSKLERLKQKQRRAQGHIQVHLQQRGILLSLGRGVFERIIFPTSFFTIVVNPFLLLATLALAVIRLLSSGFDPLAMIVTLSFVGGLTAYLLEMPKYLAGFLESQLALVIGWFMFIFKGPSHMWSKQESTELAQGRFNTPFDPKLHEVS